VTIERQGGPRYQILRRAQKGQVTGMSRCLKRVTPRVSQRSRDGAKRNSESTVQPTVKISLSSAMRISQVGWAKAKRCPP